VTRERLPDRRNADVFDFVHQNRRWTATIGRFPDGRVAELFLDAERVDPVSELAQDTAIVASIALQSGCPLETLV
jgi:ribonucleoside-diphosphate reductase alpha chain